MEVNQHLIDEPEKLAAIGRFSGRVAHEFNNLLTPLLAYPDILKSMFDPNDGDGQELIGVMATAAAELARLTRQMTQLSLGDVQGTHYEFAVRDALKAALEPLEAEFGDLTRRVQTDLADGLPKGLGRADTVCYAMESVVRNALEAVPETASIRVKASVEERPAGRTIFGVQNAAWRALVVAVEDGGEGIPADVRDSIFEPFVTTKKVEGRRRLGVGLTIVHRILRGLGGDIEVGVPKTGRGTLVRLLFRVPPVS